MAVRVDDVTTRSITQYMDRSGATWEPGYALCHWANPGMAVTWIEYTPSDRMRVFYKEAFKEPDQALAFLLAKRLTGYKVRQEHLQRLHKAVGVHQP